MFIEAAEDDRYWDKEVRRPALGFLARGKRGRDPVGTGPVPRVPSPPATNRGKKNKRKQGGGREGTPQGEDKRGLRAAKQSEGSGGSKLPFGVKSHPVKDRNGKYVTTREGTAVCFRFAMGERDACPAPCKANRAHVCQKCLQPHSNAQCPKSS